MKLWGLFLILGWSALDLEAQQSQTYTTLTVNGNLSVQSTASGGDPYTLAVGIGNTPLGLGSFCLGEGNKTKMGSSLAGGEFSITGAKDCLAFGSRCSASGTGSVAMGVSATSTGTAAMSLGNLTLAQGANSAAFNNSSVASGDSAAAFNLNTVASGAGSAAFNSGTIASGDNSAAFGVGTVAGAYAEVVIGQYNVGRATSATTWYVGDATHAADPVFEIGNGTATTSGGTTTVTPSDAFAVYKDGTAQFQKTIQVAPGGDIPMYSGS